MTMRYRRLGRTGLQVSELALGTVELGLTYGVSRPGESRPDAAEAARILHAAVDAGVNLIDTARAYGEAEAIIGRALRPRRHEIILASKFKPSDPSGALLTGAALAQEFWSSLHASLTALQTDVIDVYQAHAGADPELARRGEVAALLAQARAEGKIRWGGLSAYGVALPRLALEMDQFDTYQLAYNVLDRRLEAEVFPLARQRDAGVIVRSALLKGVLTERGDYLPPHLAPLAERSRAFRALVGAAAVALTPVQAAIRFCLASPAVSATLVGVSHLAELEEAVGAASGPALDEAILNRLGNLALDDEHLLDPGTWGIP